MTSSVKKHTAGRMGLTLVVTMVTAMLLLLPSTRCTSDAEINEEIDFHEDTGTDEDDSYLHEHPFSGGNNAAAEYETPPMSDEKRLTRHLLKKYDKAGVLGRPVVDPSTQLVVQFGVSLIQIIDLDEKSQVLTVNVWNTYRWNDTLLVWDPSNFGGVNSIRVPPYRIWTPDIVLFNYADDRLREQRDALVTVNSDGSVKWMPTAILKSSCPINIRNFPFDVQHCHLKFGSWTFDEQRLNIRQLDEHNGSMDTMTFTASKEWDLLSAPAVMDYRNMSSAADAKYPFINYTLNIRRVAVTYTFLLIIPCILLSVLNLVIFWLPPESPAKMMLGIMIFTAFFVLLQLLASLTPPAGEEPPLIGVYFCVNMIMITVSTFIAVFILYLYFRGDRKNTVPDVIRRVMLGTMVRVLCMENMMEKTGKAPPPSSSASASSSSAVAAAAAVAAAGDRHRAHQLPLIQRLSAASSVGKSNKTTTSVGNKAVLDLRPLAVEMARQYQVTPDKSPMHARALETDVKEVKRLIRNYVGRLSDKESVARAAKEWRNLSRVVDRMFFFTYLSVIVVSLATIFPKAPEV